MLPTIVHPPPMAPPPAPRSGPGRRRAERQISVSTMSDIGTADLDGDGEPDAEGEADEVDANQYMDFGEGEADDDTLYCYCQQKSYGQMIGCDNKRCQYEWVSLYTAGIRLMTIVSHEMCQHGRSPRTAELVLSGLCRKARIYEFRWKGQKGAKDEITVYACQD